MTGMGWPLDLWLVFTVLFVAMFALINRYLNAREVRFYQEHPDEELY
jgi:hypothetical protein